MQRRATIAPKGNRPRQEPEETKKLRLEEMLGEFVAYLPTVALSFKLEREACRQRTNGRSEIDSPGQSSTPTASTPCEAEASAAPQSGSGAAAPEADAQQRSSVMAARGGAWAAARASATLSKGPCQRPCLALVPRPLRYSYIQKLMDARRPPASRGDARSSPGRRRSRASHDGRCSRWRRSPSRACQEGSSADDGSRSSCLG